MKSISDYIRKIAADIDPDKKKYKLEKIQIGFKAEPIGQSLTMEKDKSKQENFQWVQYAVTFSKGGKYYLFRAEMNPDGESFKEPASSAEIYETDSQGLTENPTTDLIPADAIRAFPSILKGGPVLQYEALKEKTGIGKSDVTYWDMGKKTPGGPKFSVEKFKDVFYPKKNEKGEIEGYYIVFSTKREKKFPNGESAVFENEPSTEPEEPKEKVETL